jgi:hypothetical protein
VYRALLGLLITLVKSFGSVSESFGHHREKSLVDAAQLIEVLVFVFKGLGNRDV